MLKYGYSHFLFKFVQVGYDNLIVFSLFLSKEQTSNPGLDCSSYKYTNVKNIHMMS